MIGVYLQPWATFALLNVPASELTDRDVNLEDVWGSRSAELAAQIADLDEEARVDRLEAALLEHLRPDAIPRGTVDVVGLACWVRSNPLSATVSRLAEAAGVSRRHLARVFGEVVGVSPKRFCRLARFQTALKYVGGETSVTWAEVAAELGYADQSHMIAEFRELSGLTPEMLGAGRWFHPFVPTPGFGSAFGAADRKGSVPDLFCRNHLFAPQSARNLPFRRGELNAMGSQARVGAQAAVLDGSASRKWSRS